MSTNPQEFDPTLEYFRNELAALVRDATKDGVVLEIRLEPTKPLRMGGYYMAPSVRRRIGSKD